VLAGNGLSLGDKRVRTALSPQLVRLVEDVRGLSAADAKADEWLRTGVHDALEDALAEHDAVISPAVGVVPFENGEDGETLGPDVVAGRAVDPLLGWSLAFPVNFSGHPAACVPAGRTPDGLPVGLQIVGRRFEEANVLAVGAALQRARPWPAAQGRALLPTPLRPAAA
jgi:amidase/aspartyl-tRNA(Asn)/glutamyl-tRNA(Gln) amidotransferase subunit A